MKSEYSPQSSRARIVYMVWKNLPRFLLLLLVILSLFGFLGIKKKGKQLVQEKAEAVAEQREAVNVVVLEIKPVLLRDRINLPGSIEAWQKLELMANVAGTVEESLVTEGDLVEEGAILARIEDDDYRIALQSAKASWTLAKAELQRVQTMHARGIAPQAEMENLNARFLTAQAALDDATLKLSRCTIKAPVAGVISRLDAKPGLLLSVADPVAEILQMEKVKAVVGIPESDVVALREIDEINLEIKALGDKLFVGRKHFLAPSPESNAHVYRLELAVANLDYSILPGMFVRADIVKKENDRALAVPLYAVINRNEEQFLYLEVDGRVRKQPVKLGIMDGWMVGVTAGLATGDRVVIEGHRDVEDGQQVRVVRSLSSLEAP